jgi:transglutaminase/protease-like cytokinesis protein 3
MKNILNPSRIVLCVTVLLFSFSTVSANEYWRAEYTTADAIAAKTKKVKDVDKLAKTLTADLKEPVDKYRAIFTWVALNISYDCKAFKSQNFSDLSPEKVLAKGKSVCEGYAALFSAMCKAVGLECETIPGWTKNNFGKIGSDFAPNPTHAWNAIQLNKKWYLIDVTWAAGATEGNCDKFVKEFSPVYFCTPPETFMLNHYPRDDKWFLGAKVSKKEFQQAPHFFNKALEHNLKNLKPADGILQYKKGMTIDFQFSIDKPVKGITVKPIEDTHGTEVKFKQSGNKVSFEYKFPKKTRYLLVFFDLQGAIVYKVD